MHGTTAPAAAGSRSCTCLTACAWTHAALAPAGAAHRWSLALLEPIQEGLARPLTQLPCIANWHAEMPARSLVLHPRRERILVDDLPLPQRLEHRIVPGDLARGDAGGLSTTHRGWMAACISVLGSVLVACWASNLAVLRFLHPCYVALQRGQQHLRSICATGGHKGLQRGPPQREAL